MTRLPNLDRSIADRPSGDNRSPIADSIADHRSPIADVFAPTTPARMPRHASYVRVGFLGMPAPDRTDVLQGLLDLMILKTLAAGPRHGYAIAQRINQTSRALVQVPQGSLYPALHRLERRGLLAATWTETDTGRRARVYRLTRKGQTALDREVAGWQRLSRAIGWILET
jgi:transcriptional regulator